MGTKTNGYTYTIGGEALQRLRQKAGKSQLMVEADAELGSGYMQRIESGKVRQPERSTLERILDALDAGYSERRDILALFGYASSIPLPNDQDFAWARGVAAEELQSAFFPAYLLDCGQRLVSWNKPSELIFPCLKHHRSNRSADALSIMHLWFDPQYGVRERLLNADSFFPNMLRAFQHELSLLGRETWCTAMIEHFQRDLPSFMQQWQRAEQIHTASAARALVPLLLQLAPYGMLSFRVASEHFTRDSRFRIVYLLPANQISLDLFAERQAQTAHSGSG